MASKIIHKQNAPLSQLDQAARVCYDSHNKTANSQRWLNLFSFFSAPAKPW